MLYGGKICIIETPERKRLENFEMFESRGMIELLLRKKLKDQRNMNFLGEYREENSSDDTQIVGNILEGMIGKRRERKI